MSAHESFEIPIPGPSGSPEVVVARLDLPRRVKDRTAVLYLHGFASSQLGEKADFFRRHATQAGLAFCSFDFRGHGESAGDMIELSLSRNLADTSAVAQELGERGAERVVLLGSSMGGLTALWFAAQHPENAAAGIAIAPTLGFADSLSELLGPEDYTRWQEQGELRFVNDDGESADVGWGLIEDLQRYDEADLAKRLTTPFRLFQGQQDDRVSYIHVAAFAQHCPDLVELDLFPHGEHRLLEQLPAIWERSREFLKAQGLLD